MQKRSIIIRPETPLVASTKVRRVEGNEVMERVRMTGHCMMDASKGIPCDPEAKNFIALS